jgi:outer membrane immunogenic protein
MKRLVLAVTAAVALAASPALAADLYDPAAPIDPVSPEVYGPTVFSWAGPYVGAQLGYGWGDVSGQINGSRRGIDTDGVIGGLYGGYNAQITPNFVLGGEADISWADMTGDRTIGGRKYEARTDWAGTIRARAGASFDRILVYGTGGIAFAGNDIKKQGKGSESQTHIGWTLGAGVEGAITQNIVARGEYLYAGFDKQNYNKVGAKNVDLDTNVIRAGVAYKF